MTTASPLDHLWYLLPFGWSITSFCFEHLLHLLFKYSQSEFCQQEFKGPIDSILKRLLSKIRRVQIVELFFKEGLYGVVSNSDPILKTFQYDWANTVKFCSWSKFWIALTYYFCWLDTKIHLALFLWSVLKNCPIL